ncbi:DUF1573 domain-containing protein [Roseimaritima sediminicola]|uniref:DUF1573 domain-containing protein n=1 Tax=Roseimaritima sediminicola TaxID=2662066 RepID=UPI0012983316|nr:DUF1573 domain-containing protein [Roseimaritima sediminicola]
MKTFLLSLVVVVVAGSTAGYLTAARRYSWTPEKFGYFRKGDDLRAENLMAHVQSLRQDGMAKVEVVGGEEYDFGSMLRNAKGEHKFVIKNVGDAPLELAVLKTTCKCTLGELADSSLAPGESTTVHMTWEAKTDGKRFQQTATVSTTDPYQGELQLRIIGDIVDALSARPRNWIAGEVSGDTPLELTNTIYNRFEFDVRFKEARWLDQIRGDVDVQVDVQPVPVDAETANEFPDTRQAFEVRLRVGAGMPPGLFNYTAILEFEPVDPGVEVEDERARLTMAMGLEGRVVEDLTLTGGARLTGRDQGRYEYTMPAVDQGEAVEQSLLLLLRGPHREGATLRIAQSEPAEVLVAELGEPKIKENLTMVAVKLKIPSDAPPMQRDGRDKDDYGIVRIEADNEQIEPLVLRVKFHVRENR